MVWVFFIQSGIYVGKEYSWFVIWNRKFNVYAWDQNDYNVESFVYHWNYSYSQKKKENENCMYSNEFFNELGQKIFFDTLWWKLWL